MENCNNKLESIFEYIKDNVKQNEQMEFSNSHSNISKINFTDDKSNLYNSKNPFIITKNIVESQKKISKTENLESIFSNNKLDNQKSSWSLEDESLVNEENINQKKRYIEKMIFYIIINF